ncbi:MAG TPA: STAS domain-containing protein [Rugosimonospora sp.]|nr:STAS domain-containing protein [Rugosimonospora sp.]
MTAAAVTTRIYPHTTVIALRGDIDQAETDHLRHALVGTLMRRRPRRIVVDLTRATTLDPTAIGALRAAQDSARDLDIALDVRRPSHAMTAALTRHGFAVSAA